MYKQAIKLIERAIGPRVPGAAQRPRIDLQRRLHTWQVLSGLLVRLCQPAVRRRVPGKTLTLNGEIAR